MIGAIIGDIVGSVYEWDQNQDQVVRLIQRQRLRHGTTRRVPSPSPMRYRGLQSDVAFSLMAFRSSEKAYPVPGRETFQGNFSLRL